MCEPVFLLHRVFGSHGNPDIQASAQHNMWCGPGGGCGFTTTFGNHMGWLVANGVPSNDCWNWDVTFTGPCPSTCPNNPSASFSDRYQVKNQRDFESDAEVMAYLENVGPVVGTMSILDGFEGYLGGVYAFVNGDFIRGDHVILIYGFGTEPNGGLDYWFCKNSFGEIWGEGGNFRLARDEVVNGVNLTAQGFGGAEGVACTTMCGGICGQMRHSVCNGRGTCQGDGTCMCDAGFSGSLCETVVECGNGIVGEGEQCDGSDDALCPENCAGDCTCEPGTKIPTVSEWGLVAMALLIVTAGTLVYMRRHPATA